MSERKARSTAAHPIALAAIWGAAPAMFAGVSALEGCTSPAAPQAAVDAPAPRASSPPSAWASASAPGAAAASESVSAGPAAPPPLATPGPPSDDDGPRIPAEESGFKDKEEMVFLSELADKGLIVVTGTQRNQGGCVRRRVGSKAGLLCQGGMPHSERTGHALFSMSIFVIEGKTLRLALSFPNQARALDFPEAVYATLRVTYDEEKGVLELTDGMFPCEEATRSSDDSLEFKRVVDRLCQARGTYKLKGGAFVRAGQAPPLRWPDKPRRSYAPPPGNRSSL